MCANLAEKLNFQILWSSESMVMHTVRLEQGEERKRVIFSRRTFEKPERGRFEWEREQ